MAIDPDILIVIATVVFVFAFSSIVSGWAEGSVPWMAFASMAIGLGLLVFVYLKRPDRLGFWDIPNAFINVAGMLL